MGRFGAQWRMICPKPLFAQRGQIGRIVTGRVVTVSRRSCRGPGTETGCGGGFCVRVRGG